VNEAHQILPTRSVGRGTAGEAGGGGARSRVAAEGGPILAATPLRPLHQLRWSPSPSKLGEDF
jgi:hypothetical protein